MHYEHEKIKNAKIKEVYDVVIVGAGPAGCFLAYNLSDRYDVLLVDEKPFPRTKPCGGLLVEESQEIIRKLKPPSHIFASPKQVALEYADFENNINVRSREKRLWNVSRERFDWWFFNLLENRDIGFVSETKAIGFEAGKEIRVKLRGKKQEIVRTRYLVGADGAAAFVRRRMGGSDIKQYIAVQSRLPENMYDCVLFVYESSITDFYSWIIPKTTETVVGTAVEIPVAEKKFEMFKNLIKKRLGKEVGGMMEAALIFRPMKTDEVFLGRDNIFLVGESAGFISPTTGEGISFALRSAMNLARSFNENETNILEGYRQLCAPLIREIEDKIEKAKIFSDPERRKEYLINLKN
ncbi:MAG: FAD-dependent monooxygenase [Candidatus Micrarchaeia archaeon]